MANNDVPKGLICECLSMCKSKQTMEDVRRLLAYLYHTNIGRNLMRECLEELVSEKIINHYPKNWSNYYELANKKSKTNRTPNNTPAARAKSKGRSRRFKLK